MFHRIFIKIHLSIKKGHRVLLLLFSLKKLPFLGKNRVPEIHRVFHTIFNNHGQESLMNSMDTVYIILKMVMGFTANELDAHTQKKKDIFYQYL